MIKSNRDGSKWIEITKALLLWRSSKQHRMRFFFKEAPGWKKFYGFVNCRCRVWKYEKHKPISAENLRAFIRFPFFYWHKYNGGWEFGLPNLYLWWHEARVK